MKSSALLDDSLCLALCLVNTLFTAHQPFKLRLKKVCLFIQVKRVCQCGDLIQLDSFNRSSNCLNVK